MKILERSGLNGEMFRVRSGVSRVPPGEQSAISVVPGVRGRGGDSLGLNAPMFNQIISSGM